jgi:hypothetical protein
MRKEMLPHLIALRTLLAEGEPKTRTVLSDLFEGLTAEARGKVIPHPLVAEAFRAWDTDGRTRELAWRVLEEELDMAIGALEEDTDW